MRCILEHDKLILVAESDFEEGYLGELLSNKMQGTAKRDSMGNISQLEFFKKKELIDMDEDEQSIVIHIPGQPIPVTEFDYNEAEEIEELSDEETVEFVEVKKEELVVDMMEELDTIEDTLDIESKVIKPRAIEDLGHIEIDDGLDDLDDLNLDNLDLDNMEINFDEVDLNLEN